MKVDIGGETFDFSPDVLKTMFSDMGKTANDKKERGFLMCDVGGQIVPGKHCRGDKCSIHLEGCEGVGPVIGSFHSHPEVISFSMADYIHELHQAGKHPQHKGLMCVSLLDQGLRCKAVVKMPPKGTHFLPWPDNDENRDKIKPYFTKRINIGVKQMAALLEGMSWDKLPEEAPIVAIDEGENVFVDMIETEGGKPLPPGTKKIESPLKQSWKTVKGEAGKLVKIPIAEAEVVGGPQFVAIADIETPDPAMIDADDLAKHVAKIKPVQLLQEKDAQGKFKIHDGRHRLLSWKVSGFDKAPVVFVKPGLEKKP